MKVTVKTFIALDKDEREMLANLENNLRNICNNMYCGGLHCSTNCPLNNITDHAHDLADEISKFLAESESE